MPCCVGCRSSRLCCGARSGVRCGVPEWWNLVAFASRDHRRIPQGNVPRKKSTNGWGRGPSFPVCRMRPRFRERPLSASKKIMPAGTRCDQHRLTIRRAGTLKDRRRPDVRATVLAGSRPSRCHKFWHLQSPVETGSATASITAESHPKQLPQIEGRLLPADTPHSLYA
jgi:hypothetical protein